MLGIGWMEMAVIAAVGLVVVGPDKLPEMVRGVAGLYRGLHQAFLRAQSTVKTEMALLELELNQAAEPETTGRQTLEPPKEDRADGDA